MNLNLYLVFFFEIIYNATNKNITISLLIRKMRFLIITIEISGKILRNRATPIDQFRKSTQTRMSPRFLSRRPDYIRGGANCRELLAPAGAIINAVTFSNDFGRSFRARFAHTIPSIRSKREREEAEEEVGR